VPKKFHRKELKMKKTIASVALLASSSTFALIGPGPRPEPKTVCLNVYEESNGVMYAGDCDQTRANQVYKRTILQNGCADGQAAIRSYDIKIKACPTYVQL
jgi:hypothetical protein